MLNPIRFLKLKWLEYKDLEKKEEEIAKGSEAVHDAGLTDQEMAAPNPSRDDRLRLFIRHNDKRPEEKIHYKQHFKSLI